MSMSDELSGATVHVASTVVETTTRTSLEIIKNIADLLIALRKAKADKNEFIDMGAGETKISKLVENARKNKDGIISSENGLSDFDRAFLSAKAKEYGIPIAFTQPSEGGNHYAHVRASDVPVFKRMCTDLIEYKIHTPSTKVDNFRCEAWETKFLKNELNKYNISAQFGCTKANGNNPSKFFCLFDKKDKQAVLLARAAFINKAKEVQNFINFEKNFDDGFVTIKDIKLDQKISFDKTPSYNELKDLFVTQFGYDENKAGIAANRFGEEMLIDPDEKKKFFANSPVSNFSHIDTNIKIENENIYTQAYTCFHLQPKADEKARIVFQNDEGKFVALAPSSMSRAEMHEEISKCLQISDEKEIAALIDKAKKVEYHYAKQNENLFRSSYELKKEDFDMRDPNVVERMVSHEKGHTYTRKLPVDSMDLSIERLSKDKFSVASYATHWETDENDLSRNNQRYQTIVCSFSDKKQALHELEQLYHDQGVPESVAKTMANETFAKAKSQDAEKVIRIEEISIEAGSANYSDISASAVVSSAGQTASIDISPKSEDELKEQLMDKFGIDDKHAEILKDDLRTTREAYVLHRYGFDCDGWNLDEAHEVIRAIEQNHWKVPEGIDPKTYVPERLKGIDTSKVVDLAKDIKLEPIARGGR